jgi:predicted phosphodiesterase
LRAALGAIRQRGCDQLVILGDLLSYGPDVHEVLDLVAQEVARGARLLYGNHEEIYLEPDGDYAQHLSPMLRECASWVRTRLDPSRLRALPFERDLVLEGVWFSHANPWGDWTYLNGMADHRRAADVLLSRGIHVGVFGHTHRGKIVTMPEGTGVDVERPHEAVWEPSDGRCLVLNAGSVGQPRNRAAQPTFLLLDHIGDAWHAKLKLLEYDVDAHIVALSRLPLSSATRERLIAFHHPRV